MIDVQEGFRKAVPSFDQVARATAALVKGAKAVGIPIVVTEQYPKGLGSTVPEVADQLPDGLTPIEKVCFSAPEAEGFDLAGRDQALVCGIEAHVCVNQTALDLLDEGIEVHVASDAVGSRFDENREIGLAKAERAGAVITSVETALFELVGRRRDRRVQAGAEGGPRLRAQSVMSGYVLLEDGARFDGELCEGPEWVTGEVVFNTAMTGYQESVTDPSYAGQIITFTYPLIGNYGVAQAAMESDRAQARGVIMREAQERRGRTPRPRAAGSTGCATAGCPRSAAWTRGRWCAISATVERCAAGSSPASWPRPRPGSGSRRSRPWLAPTWPAR